VSYFDLQVDLKLITNGICVNLIPYQVPSILKNPKESQRISKNLLFFSFFFFFFFSKCSLAIEIN